MRRNCQHHSFQRWMWEESQFERSIRHQLPKQEGLKQSIKTRTWSISREHLKLIRMELHWLDTTLTPRTKESSIMTPLMRLGMQRRQMNWHRNFLSPLRSKQCSRAIITTIKKLSTRLSSMTIRLSRQLISTRLWQNWRSRRKIKTELNLRRCQLSPKLNQTRRTWKFLMSKINSANNLNIERDGGRR